VGEQDVEATLGGLQGFSRKCLVAVGKLRHTLERFDRFGSSAERSKLEHDIEFLEAEAATWDLLYLTCVDLRTEDAEKSAEYLMRVAQDKWVSDEQFFQLACKHDFEMRRWRRIVAWLENVYSTQHHFGAAVRTDEYWENTTRSLHRGTELESRDGVERELITHVDPDAPLREEGKQLHSLDETLDNRLMKRMWELVRAGRIGEAVREAEGCSQHWRSATLFAMQNYHDPKALRSDDIGDARGNANPKLLRSVAAKISQMETGINVYEKALYGLFGGQLMPVLAVCNGTADCMWAKFKLNLLHKTLRYRGEAHGEIFPEDGILDVGLSSTTASASQMMFQKIQNCIIKGELNQVMELLASSQQQGDNVLMSRFCVTFALVLSKVSVPVFNPEPHLTLEDAYRAIEQHVRVLTPLDKPALVVAHCNHLAPERRVPCMATFIANAVKNTSIAEAKASEVNFSISSQEETQRKANRIQTRRLKYIRAMEAAQLPTVQVLLQVVLHMLPSEHIAVQAFNFGDLNSSRFAFDAQDGLGSHLPLIEILGWLSIRFEHYRECIFVCNQICRALALRHRVSHLKEVLQSLPEIFLEKSRQDCVESKENSYAFEIEYWRTLCDAYDSFSEWKIAHEANALHQEEELEALYVGCEANLRRIIDFPDSPLFSSHSQELRELQLFVIRDSFIPQAFFMLHYLHFQMDRPHLSLALADDCADQRRRLFAVFERSNMLQRFLALMKESSVQLLRKGSKDILGYDE